jgi:hypothetical protein
MTYKYAIFSPDSRYPPASLNSSSPAYAHIHTQLRTTIPVMLIAPGTMKPFVSILVSASFLAGAAAAESSKMSYLAYYPAKCANTYRPQCLPRPVSG